MSCVRNNLKDKGLNDSMIVDKGEMEEKSTIQKS